MGIERMREDLANRQQRGLAFVLAAILAWLAVLVGICPGS